MKSFQPIYTITLFPELDRLLIELLHSLSTSDWEKQTLAPKWTVKDVAAHLLDGNLRALSMLRDNYFGEKPDITEDYSSLVNYLNQLNADWVKAMKRISPKLLAELLSITGKAYIEYLKTLNPHEEAIFSVAWAGEKHSQNWFHIAREYTEKWHHQQQIRYAMGNESILLRRDLYYPFLETSMRALPYHYRDIAANQGEMIEFIITGDGGGTWSILFTEKKWVLVDDNSLKPICKVLMDGQIAWRIFSKAISREEAEKFTKIEGQTELGLIILDMRAVMM